MKALILCGGRGTRAYPHTRELPKPLLEVGGRPVLRHLMNVFVAQGYSEFVLAAGFKSSLVEMFAERLPASWKVEVVDTGLDAGTADRINQCRWALGERFFVTYGDGLADVDLLGLERFHAAHLGAITVTTVPLPSAYGVLDVDDADGRVRAFTEKPVLHDRWINAGFFVVDDEVLSGLYQGPDFERDLLPPLAEEGLVYAYRHTGFWRSLDTWKDAVELDELCREGRPPWLPPRRVVKPPAPAVEPVAE